MYALIINKTIEKYPYSIGELRKDNPQTSFPKNPSDALLADWGVFPVKPTGRPQVDHTKNVAEGTPVQQGGEWVQVWVVTNATPEEIAERTEAKANEVRAERDQRLAECDWVVIKSVEVLTPEFQDWKDYRQALRDVPQQEGFPWNVIWPTFPTQLLIDSSDDIT
jgi:hypothetical protein